MNWEIETEGRLVEIQEEGQGKYTDAEGGKKSSGSHSRSKGDLGEPGY